ncbi:amidohydrolase [Litorimonas sp. RW-G-Af-16]|uniref:amidohydrolase n=1 Tax=Litorimonas sp. RW-G-Af-16 TaxID=3241168 RepID=UPI003AAFEAE8
MTSTTSLVVFIAALTLVACQGTASKTKSTSKDWCISGGTIYTANDANTIIEAVAVRDGKISYAGPNTGEWCLSNSQTQTIDLAGAAMYPGFTDAHGHLLGIGLREMTLNLEGTKSIAELKERLAAAVTTTPDGETVFGRGWIETHWPEKRFPNREDLDEVAPNNPVILVCADGHAAVINSAAMKAAGITKKTQSPFGGAINKNAAGEPNGMLIDYAIDLVEDLLPSLTEARKEEAYIKGAALYASRGWTNIHSMSVIPADVPMLNRLAAEGKIKIRVYNSLDVLDKQIMGKMKAMDTVEDDQIITRAIKLYADGALGSRGAALLAPYSDDEKNEGLMLMKDEQARSILQAALRNGTQVNTHAIGDKANRLVLDWYEDAFTSVPKSEWSNPDPRWRIEHSQIIDVADIPRFAELGVIPSMQPSHAIGDLHFAVDRLGPNRLAGAYAWQALIDSGAIIAGGSDAPVEVGDPRIEFYAATQRMDLQGYSNENWNREQRVSAESALKMFTAWPAYAAFEENVLGTIEVGKAADFTAFDRDIMTASADDVLTAKVEFTMVGGDMAYQAK